HPRRGRQWRSAAHQRTRVTRGQGYRRGGRPGGRPDLDRGVSATDHPADRRQVGTRVSRGNTVDISFSKHTLANGLDVLLHEAHGCPIIAVNIWYHVGSKNERPGHTGFAHLFE